MKKFTLSVIAISCALALTACSSSSKGGSDNSAQLRKTEESLRQQLANVEKKASEAQQAADKVKSESAEAQKKLTDAESKTAMTQKEKEETAKRLQDLENLQADEKARIPVSDKIFGGVSGSMQKSVSGFSGGVWTEDKGGWSINAPATTEGINDLLIVDKSGRTRHVQLLDSEYTLVSQDYSSGSISSSREKLPDVRFGVYMDALDGSQAVYSQGYATPESQIPTSGTATYKGGATYQIDGKELSAFHSPLKAEVDFANKTVDLSVDKRGSVPEMKFAAKITANSFAGEVNGIKTQGGFFGENASQLSGIYVNEAEKTRGAYGAVKQDK